MSRRVEFSRTGGTDVLEVIDVSEPHPSAGKVRVAVRSASLNPFDSKVRTGLIPVDLPSGQGSDFAGIVDEVGEEVTDVAVGDDVIGWTLRKAQADFVIVPSSQTAPKPAGLPWDVASAIGVVMGTARRAIDGLDLTAASVLYISGIAGGVGLAAAQFAVASGCTVIGTARDSNHDFVRSLGAIPVAPGDQVAARLREAASAALFSAAVDTVGRSQVEVALELGIRPSRIISIEDHAGPAELGIVAVSGGRRTRTEIADYAVDLAEGRLVLPIRATYPLAEVREAYDELENGHGLGKIVLEIST